MHGCGSPFPTWNAANQIIVGQDGRLMITGTASGISKTAGIKSPYIISLDAELNQLSKKTIATPTTAINPKLLIQANGNKILSFYRAESKDIQTEHAHILYLDKDKQLIKENKYGHRLRIEDLSVLNNGDLLAYHYDRGKLNTSLSSIKDSIIAETKTFALSEESNIPTDMLLVNDTAIYISAIANGFHYKDGHEYKNPKAYEYILKLDMELNEINRRMGEHKQHSFVNHMLAHEGDIITTGTQLNESYGMDVRIERLNHQLEKKTKHVFTRKRNQKGIKSISAYKQFYILCQDSNEATKKSNILLIQTTPEGITRKETKFVMEDSYIPIDFVEYEGHFYIIAHKQSTKRGPLSSVVIMVDKEANVIKEKIID